MESSYRELLGRQKKVNCNESSIVAELEKCVRSYTTEKLHLDSIKTYFLISYIYMARMCMVAYDMCNQKSCWSLVAAGGGGEDDCRMLRVSYAPWTRSS